MYLVSRIVFARKLVSDLNKHRDTFRVAWLKNSIVRARRAELP